MFSPLLLVFYIRNMIDSPDEDTFTPPNQSPFVSNNSIFHLFSYLDRYWNKKIIIILTLSKNLLYFLSL